VERSIDLIRRPAIKPLIDNPRMADLAESMLRKSLGAFVERNPELARSVLVSNDAVDNLQDAVYQELIDFMESDSSTIPGGFDLIFVAHNLERIADHGFPPPRVAKGLSLSP